MSQDKKPLDPYKTMCVVKNDKGKEVGRVAATATNASDYITELVRQYGHVTVDYVHDENADLLAKLWKK